MDGIVNHPVFKKLFAFTDNFIYSLTKEHIIAFGVVFALFVIFIILSVAFNRKKSISFSLLASSLAIIIIGPIVAYDFVEKEYKPIEYRDITIRQLQFQDGIVIKGFIVNRSKKYLKECKISAKVYKNTDSEIGKFLGLIKPKARGKTEIKKELLPNTIGYFRIQADRVKYSDDIDVSLKVRCR